MAHFILRAGAGVEQEGLAAGGIGQPGGEFAGGDPLHRGKLSLGHLPDQIEAHGAALEVEDRRQYDRDLESTVAGPAAPAAPFLLGLGVGAHVSANPHASMIAAATGLAPAW